MTKIKPLNELEIEGNLLHLVKEPQNTCSYQHA